MRKSEIASLKRHHVFGDEIQIVEQKNHGIVGTVIPISPEARAIIERQPVGRSPFVFETRDGGLDQRITEMFRDTVRRAQIRAQREGQHLTPMTFHDLRHEYAIRFLKAGGSLYALQKILRHSTIAQTEWYLTFLTPDQSDRVR